MRVAFYAPLKPPDSPRPSGDRRMARLLLKCLKARGHDVVLASRMRSREASGDLGKQIGLRDRGRRLAQRLVHRYTAPGAWCPEVWFTYHLFYKAPDWIGPAVADALSIPYVVVEASHAPKRAHGPWNFSHRQVERTLRRASLVIGLNSRDRACVEPVIGPRTRYETMRPFLDPRHDGAVMRDTARASLSRRHGLPEDAVWLLAVAMMRADAKLESYQVLGAALQATRSERPWRLLVVGDGPARQQVEAALGPGVVFTGALSPDALADYYAASDLFVWPAIREAYGMALLEAQAAGLPAVAGDTGGVPDILRDGRTGLLAPIGDAEGFARSTARLIDDPALRTEMAAAARTVMARDHDFEAAAARLDALLTETVRAHGAGS